MHHIRSKLAQGDVMHRCMLFLTLTVVGLIGCQKTGTGGGPDVAAQQAEALKALQDLGATVEPAEPSPEHPVVEISLSGDKVTDDALTYVARFPKLKRLSLENTAVTGAGLAKLNGVITLERLNLSGSKRIGDEDLRRIAHLAGINSLRLNDTAVTDAGMPTVARLTGLRALELSNTAVGDAGLEKLKPLIVLKELMINGTKVTDAGLEPLKGLPALETVYASGTGVTIAGVEKLRPKIKVIQ
jgi:hypothetical protein